MIDGPFIIFAFLNSCINSSHLLTKLLADDLVALWRSTVLSPMSFDRSLGLPMVLEKFEWMKLILRSAVLYTHNELRSVTSVIN